MDSKRLTRGQLSVALELTAHTDGLVDGLRRGTSLVHRFGKGVSSEFRAIGEAWNSKAANLGKVGLGLGGSAYFGQATKTFADAEHTLRGMGNAGDLTNKQLSSVQRELLQTAKDTNQFRESLIGGLNVLVSSGMEFDRSKRLIRDIGFAATGSMADIEDLSKTVYALDSNLKVLPKDMGKALNILTNEGFAGAFELKDMARYFPIITAEVQKLKMAGPSAAASIGAALQISRRVAGTPEEAATNLKDYLTKITSKETTENLSKAFDIDWKDVYENRILKSKDPLFASVEFFKQQMGDNPFNMNKVFGNNQSMTYLTSMFQNMDDYKKIRDEGLGNSDTISKAFNANMGTSIEQMKRMRIITQAITEESKSLNAVWRVGFDLLKHTNDRLAQGDISLEKLAGGGAALAGGAYIGSRLLKGAAGAVLGSLGGKAAGLATGLATGKALQEFAGVQSVFVVNMPGNGLGGFKSTLAPASAGALAGAGTRVAGSASLLGSASALALSGAAGYAIGEWGINPLLTDYAKDRIGRAFADFLSPFSHEARKSVDRTERYQRRTGGEDAGGHDWTTPGTHAFMADTLGFGAAKVLGFFGSQEAKNALAINENKEVQRRLANIGPNVGRAIQDSNNSLGDKLEQTIREALDKASAKKVDMTLTLKGQPAIVEKFSAQGASVNVDSGLLGMGH